MPLISVISKAILYVVISVTLIACTAGRSATDAPSNIEHRAIKAADEYLEKERYRDVHKILTAFMEKYPNSEYADDAAYRLAYLHVVYSEDNPYFNYKQAHRKFLEFSGNFPGSRYLYACNNWLKVLNLNLDSNVKNHQGVVYKKDDCDGLKKQVDELKRENQQLREVLKDLESALDR